MIDQFTTQFLIEEFKGLRQEMEAAKERAFRIYAVGILIVPALSQLFQYLHPMTGTNTETEDDLFLIGIKTVFPFFILAVMVLYMAENITIKRCGSYIRDNLEIYIKDYGIEGWETWLSSKQDIQYKPRQYSSGSFYAIFLMYYWSICLVQLTQLVNLAISRSSFWAWLIIPLIVLAYLFFGSAVQCFFYHGIFVHNKKDEQCLVYNTIFVRILRGKLRHP